MSVYESCIDIPRRDSDTQTNHENHEVLSEMQNALTAIAQEVRRFCHLPLFVKTCLENEELRLSKIKLKKIITKRLSQDLKCASVTSRTTLYEKRRRNFNILRHNLNIARTQSASLLEKNFEYNKIISKLTSDNKILNDNLQNIENFIEFSYRELQNMCKAQEEEQSPLLKLKQIIASCGKYYADYNNAQEKCSQLTQRNRFLTNKLNILESNLKSSTTELNRLRNLKIQKCRDIDFESGPKVGSIMCELIRPTKSLTKFRKRDKNLMKTHIENMNETEKNANFDLCLHFSLVKSLLKDQDTILKDLRELSNELKKH